MLKKEVGSIEDAIEYFNTHPSLFEKEENDKGHMERVMAVLTQDNMENLEKQFQLYSRGLELPTFIYLIKKLYIPDHELSKYFFVSDLIKFFQAIDINGDGHLEWSQFTEYIIENIRVVEKPKYKNRAYEENQIISSAYSKVSNEYRINKMYDLNCQNLIKKIIYMEQSKNYYVLQSPNSSIRIYDKNFKIIDIVTLEQKNEKSFIIDFSLDKENTIIGCIFEEALHFCNMKAKSAVKFVNRQELPEFKNSVKLQFLSKHRLWGVLNKFGSMILVDISYNSRTLVRCNIVRNLCHHEAMITEILQTDEPKCIATASMDGQIKLYSKFLDKTYTFEHIGEQTNSAINKKMKKGILGISYTSQFGNYLLSFSFSFEIYVYCLDISVSKGYVGKYTEHTGIIRWAKFLKGFPYILSFDDKLNMRIWDFRKFQTIQFINCQKSFINPSCLQLVPDLNEILICEKKVTQFLAPALEKKSREINEFHNIFDFKFCPNSNNIFVFTSNDVRVYNYFTGTLKKLFTKLYQSNYETNITACEFGFKCKRFFVGDAGGFVREFCSQTGQCLQDINPSDELNYENKQIVSIIFLKDFSILICCSIDGRLMIYERDQSGEYVIIRDIRQCHEQLVCAAASSRYCLLATGGEDGTVNIWNLEKYSLESTVVITGKPVGIAFSPIHPLMLVAGSDGYINFVFVRPYEGKLKYKCFCKVQIGETYLPQKITSFSFELMINAYFPKNNVLNTDQQGNHHLIVCLGTQSGRIYLINLNKLIKIYSIIENHQIYLIKSFQRCQIQVMRGIIINQRNRILLNGASNSNVPNHNYEEFPNFIIRIQQGPIETVLISKENSAVFSKSIDKKMKIWSFNAQYNGAINFSTFKKCFWKIPEVNFYKKLQAIDTTLYSIKLIENKKFDPEEEKKIKVHLLLNQYLTHKEKQDYYHWLKVRKRQREEQWQSEGSDNILKSRKYDKNKNNVNNDAMTEQQFNQVYHKLIGSIQKSLEQYDNSERIFWGDKRNTSQKQKTCKKQEANDGFYETNMGQGKSRSLLRKRTIQHNLKGTNLMKRKFDARMELFGKKKEDQNKKQKPKRSNILFTSLSTARKIIASHQTKTRRNLIR